MNWTNYNELSKTRLTLEIPTLLLDAINETSRSVHGKELDEQHRDFQLSASLYDSLQEMIMAMRRFKDKERFAKPLAVWDRLQEAMLATLKEEE